MKKLYFTFFLIVFTGSVALNGQTAITFGYDNAGNRISRAIDCEGQPKVELGDPTAAFCEGNIMLVDAGTGFESYIWNGEEGESQLVITNPGTYRLEVVDEFGCISSDEVDVSIIASEIINLGGDVTICEGNSHILDAGSSFETNSFALSKLS